MPKSSGKSEFQALFAQTSKQLDYLDDLDVILRFPQFAMGGPSDKLTGTITAEFWKRKHDECSARLNWIKGEQKQMEGDPFDELASMDRIIELSQKAYSLYVKRNPHEQRELRIPAIPDSRSG